MPSQQIEKLLTTILREIVTEFIAHPEHLEINSRCVSRIISINWRGHRADTGRMIGEGGQTYHFLRQLLILIGEVNGYYVDLARAGDPVVGEPERYDGFTDNPDWPRRRLLAVLKRTVQTATHYPVEVEESEMVKATSAVTVKIDRRESLNTETVLSASLKHLAKAMFNANGRLIRLRVERSLESDEQPETSAGRFCS